MHSVPVLHCNRSFFAGLTKSSMQQNLWWIWIELVEWRFLHSFISSRHAESSLSKQNWPLRRPKKQWIVLCRAMLEKPRTTKLISCQFMGHAPPEKRHAKGGSALANFFAASRPRTGVPATSFVICNRPFLARNTNNKKYLMEGPYFTKVAVTGKWRTVDRQTATWVDLTQDLRDTRRSLKRPKTWLCCSLNAEPMPGQNKCIAPPYCEFNLHLRLCSFSVPIRNKMLMHYKILLCKRVILSPFLNDGSLVCISGGNILIAHTIKTFWRSGLKGFGGLFAKSPC